MPGSAKRVFRIDNGSSHRGAAAAERLARRYPNLVLIHLPVHASWLDPGAQGAHAQTTAPRSVSLRGGSSTSRLVTRRAQRPSNERSVAAISPSCCSGSTESARYRRQLEGRENTSTNSWSRALSHAASVWTRPRIMTSGGATSELASSPRWLSPAH